MFITLASLQSFNMKLNEFFDLLCLIKYTYNSTCLHYNHVEPTDFYPQHPELNLYSDNCHYYLEDKVIGRLEL